MKRRFFIRQRVRVAQIAVSLALAFTLLSVSATQALAQGPPSYLILRAPAKTHKGKAYQNGRGYEAPAHAYSYGWFGAKPRSHWRCHIPYYANYFQWSKR